jgi:hypothetical protein
VAHAGRPRRVGKMHVLWEGFSHCIDDLNEWMGILRYTLRSMAARFCQSLRREKIKIGLDVVGKLTTTFVEPQQRQSEGFMAN